MLISRGDDCQTPSDRYNQAFVVLGEPILRLVAFDGSCIARTAGTRLEPLALRHYRETGKAPRCSLGPSITKLAASGLPWKETRPPLTAQMGRWR
jgi:hypothetical protein